MTKQEYIQYTNLIDRETAIKRSKEFVNELLSLQLNLRKAILFGSFVSLIL